MTPKRQAVLLAVLAVFLFVPPIFFMDLWTPDEPRYAEVAREMRITGNYLVPQRNQEAYAEKPPLLFWLIAASSIPFGDVTEIATRIPSIVAAMLTVLLTYLLAARAYSARVAFWSSLVLITNLRFWLQAHTGQIDMVLTASMTLSLYALWRRFETKHVAWLIPFYLGMTLGLYAKGPPALVFPLLGALAFYWGNPSGRKRLHLVIGTAIAVAAIGLWLLPARLAVEHGVAEQAAGNIGGDLYKQIVGRIFLGVSHAQPPWYYLVNLPVDWLPWTLFLPWTVVYVWRNRHEGPAMRLLLSWTLPAFVFFTLISGKRAVYLLPLYPVFAILTARSVLALAEQNRRKWLAGVAAAWLVCLVLVGSAPGLVRLTPYGEAWRPATLALTAVAVVGIGWTLFVIFRGRLPEVPVALGAQTVAIWAVIPVAVFPMVNHFKSAKPFCAPVRLLAEHGGVTAYSAGLMREEYVFYSKTYLHVSLRLPGENALKSAFPAEAANKAYRLRMQMESACDAVPLSSLVRPTETERQALVKAVNRAIDAAGLPADDETAYRAAVRAEVAQFVEQADQRQPAVIFVEEQDWRWMLTFIPNSHELTVLKNEQVGSRRMVLLGNEATVQRLAELESSGRAKQDMKDGGKRWYDIDPSLRIEGIA